MDPTRAISVLEDEDTKKPLGRGVRAIFVWNSLLNRNPTGKLISSLKIGSLPNRSCQAYRA